ncbi:MAG: hypothetical protein QM648_08345 [Solirubrobacterales bacterium]
MLKLVYACLAVSFIALVVLIVSASDGGHAFRGTTKPMYDTLTSSAEILAADKNGAITQTGNGLVAGYRRGGTSAAWTFKFDPFANADEMSWNDAVPTADSWCAGACPSAIVGFGARYSAHGGASAALANTLSAQNTGLLQPLVFTSANAGFARLGGVRNASSTLVQIKDSVVTTLPVEAPSVVVADKSGARIASGSPNDQGGELDRLELADGKWTSAAPSLAESGLRNICISSDGRWVGAISHRALLMAFADTNPIVAGNPAAGGICTADSGGFTVVVNPADHPNFVAAARYTHDGRRIWARTFGAQRLLSPTGSPLIVTATTDGHVTAIDSVTGKVELQQRFSGPAFVTADGSIVTTGREGKPVWLYVPGISETQ